MAGTHPAIWLSNRPLPEWVLQADHWMRNLVVVTLPDIKLYGDCICGQNAEDDYDMDFPIPDATPDPIESDDTRVGSTLPPSSAPRDTSPEIQTIEEWEWNAGLLSQERQGALHHSNVFLEDL